MTDEDELYRQMIYPELRIIEELEKIKTEINFIAEKCLPNSLAEEYEVKGMTTAIEIINGHIYKLKGE